MSEIKGKGIDRRDFLKGAIAAGGAAAVAGLGACSPSNASGSGTGGSAASGAGAGDGVGKHSWEVKPAAITDIAEEKDYDIVIVGAGLAGLSAAEAAARCGASVAVLERTETFQVRGVDVGHIGSKWQLDNGGLPVDPVVAAKLLHLWSQQTTNYNLIKTWATRSGQVFDHIEEIVKANDMKFVHALSGTAKYGWDTLPERWVIYPDAISVVRNSDDDTLDTRPDGVMVNQNLGDALYAEAVAQGAEFVFSTHAEQLVGDASSGISGVIASAEDGSYIQYNAAKGVILATGDICGNQEMIDAWSPICNRADGNVYSPVGGNTGDAILMACWAGGTYSKSPAAPMVHQFTMDTISFNLTAFIMSWLAVNRNGDRYGAELPFEPYLTNARMNTPGSVAWSIFDSDYETYVRRQWPEEDAPGKADKWLAGTTGAGVAADIEERLAADPPTVFKADTIEELAEQIGVPAENLVATVERYNSMCDKGADDDFEVPAKFLAAVKTAPFYATPLPCSVLTIPFGIHVNDDSQACTEDDEPIPGLFAVGNAQGDFFGLAYPVHCPGISHGRSVTFGQLVGEALAQDTVISKTA